MLERHSATAHAAYTDLVRSLRDDAVSDLRGTATRVERSGRTYWYDSYRVGSDVRKRYIGEDGPELRARLEQAEALKATRDERRRHRTRLIRILRAEGFLSIDAATGSLLSALAGAGVFRLGGTIVGTHAFRLYEGVLGIRYSFDQTAQTGDLDIASFERLSLALEDVVSPPLQAVLKDFAFDPAPSLEPHRTWRWRQTKSDLLVEFLTPSFEEDEGLRPLAALGVDAQALHHMNYLIAEPIRAAVPYRSGVLVQIPRPERFAIHKLIVADRRRDADALKAEKDRLQSAFLVEALAQDRPDELAEAYEDALSAGPKWRARLERTLRRMPAVAARLRAVAG
jgi:hypothetical protein